MEYRIAPKKKKVKTRPYSILIQKSKGSSAFDEQKVKNIEYRLQSIFPNPAYRQRLATAATFLRSCVFQALIRGDGARHSSHALRRNNVSN